MVLQECSKGVARVKRRYKHACKSNRIEGFSCMCVCRRETEKRVLPNRGVLISCAIHEKNLSVAKSLQGCNIVLRGCYNEKRFVGTSHKSPTMGPQKCYKDIVNCERCCVMSFLIF
jgi:hypothetical protein